MLFLTLGLTACKDEAKSPDCKPCQQVALLSREQGQAYLIAQYADIESISTSTPCTDASKWEIIPIGSKACGGPTGFMAYQPSEHGAGFLKKVADYTNAQATFNKKWGVFSDCSLAIKPTKVECVEGKVKLIN